MSHVVDLMVASDGLLDYHGSITTCGTLPFIMHLGQCFAGNNTNSVPILGERTPI